MIAVDIGNTSLQFGWFKKGKMVRTVSLGSSGITRARIKRLLSKYRGENILVCSVVPEITDLFEGLANKVEIAGRNIKVPIKCLYDKKKVGMDRLVGAFSAKVLYPGARFILDFGSAITLDFLSKKGDYQGGIILPGIGSTQRALSNCALLPKRVRFQKTKKMIPTTTKDSINKGLEEGFSAMANSLVKKYKKKLKIRPSEKVIITGGEAKVVMSKLDFPYKYEPFLVLKGLNILAKKPKN